MKNNVILGLAVSFLPFVLFALFNSKTNVKKENRNRQYAMPLIAAMYSIIIFICMNRITAACTELVLKLADFLEKISVVSVADYIRNLYTSWGILLELVLFNTAALLFYVIVKRILTAILGKIKVHEKTAAGSVVGLFYQYDEINDQWYIKEHYGQACTFMKTAYYGSCFVSAVALLISCYLCMRRLVSAPFYPVFAVIIIGEMAFFVDGPSAIVQNGNFQLQADNSHHIAMYPLLRKPLKALFGDKLSAEGTSVNNGISPGGAIEDVLTSLEQVGGHVGKNYACFIRKKMETGLKPNVDYVRCGFDLATGKSLLFNTPFYDKLNPYVFYAMNRELLTGGKILIVLGRHGTEQDLRRWIATGMKSVSNIPDLWKISVLSGEKMDEEEMPDIGIVSRSGVHDLDIHRNGLPFLRKVSFVFVVEPSRLITTAQIGLNLLIRCCGKDCSMTFCSVDRNCDGLVDALSHILMTNITEVSATEYPHGMSSYMYWTEDGDYLQHRILPGISRYLGIGIELSMVALKNQVKETVWYGGETFPVLDAHWIAKQYYHDLLSYAHLPTNQEMFDQLFKTSINMCDERVSDCSFVTVEDDRNNVFEIRRVFATIAEQQGFVNVISTEYMLREYMATNTELFTTDAKAIPYIAADFARTKRNAIISLCLQLCIDSVKEETLQRQMVMLNVDTKNPAAEVWKEICVIFGNEELVDKRGMPILSVELPNGEKVRLEKDTTMLFKRAYDIESGKFENVYSIENESFSKMILDDLQNASYIAEQESEDVYIGTELKGHVYQKYMPGQFLTLNGKYYEMVSTATNNRILVRRASEYIGGRLSYRQIRHYTIHHIEDGTSMGTLKTVNNIDVHYQFADFSVETPGYWKLHAYNDFDNGDMVRVNGVPTRLYHHKQILKFDFSKYGDLFTDSVRMTLTNLLNETFVTLFAENQPFISAVTLGSYGAPLTYSLAFDKEQENAEKSIFIIEDSQLDIGLLIAVERNINRIMNLISDYLSWNEEQIVLSVPGQNTEGVEADEKGPCEEAALPEKKKGFFSQIKMWFKNLFKRREKDDAPLEDKLTARQKKKAEKAVRKAEKKAVKEQRKAEKRTEKETRKAQKKADRLRKGTETSPISEIETEGQTHDGEESLPYAVEMNEEGRKMAADESEEDDQGREFESEVSEDA